MEHAECVIVVGTDLEKNVQDLLPALEAGGFQVVRAPTLDTLNVLLRTASEALIAVYEPRGAGLARQVLRAVAKAQRGIPVVVVASEGNLDEYYELMNEGAYDYFDVRDGAGAIERSVRWALQAA